MPKAFWSDNGETVIVSEDGDCYCYSVGEFTEMYGEDALPEPNAKKDSFLDGEHHPTNIDKYYNTLVFFLNAVGSYIHFRKLGQNADEGIFPVQQVVRDYGYDNSSKYDIELDNRKCRYLNYLKELSALGGRIGFSDIDDESKKKILSFVKDRDRRRYLRDAARKAQKKGDLISLNGLIRKRIELETKRK